MLAVAWFIMDWRAAALCTVLLAYEGWTLTNRWPGDTLSEAVWFLSRRPMIPWIFGVASGWALAAGVFPNAYTVATWFFLQGHFFFQAYREEGEVG
jgi:hypothetical protein